MTLDDDFLQEIEDLKQEVKNWRLAALAASDLCERSTIERNAAVARIAAVEARNTAALALARFYSCDANGYDEITAALAASPTPTGPEPTTKAARWMPAPDTTWVNGVPSDVIQVGPGGADPKE